jgi:hypothetical protein
MLIVTMSTFNFQVPCYTNPDVAAPDPGTYDFWNTTFNLFPEGAPFKQEYVAKLFELAMARSEDERLMVTFQALSSYLADIGRNNPGAPTILGAPLGRLLMNVAFDRPALELVAEKDIAA